MIPNPGRFHEFMTQSGQVQPDDLDPVYDEKRGIEQTQEIPIGPELVTKQPGPEAQRATPESKREHLWTLAPDKNVPPDKNFNPDGGAWMWDGSKPLSISLPERQYIRALFFMKAPPASITIYSGAQTGTALYSSVQPNGTLAIPLGIAEVTLVSTGTFVPIAIYASALPLPPTPTAPLSGGDFPAAASPFFINASGYMTTASPTLQGSAIEVGSYQGIYIRYGRVRGLDAQGMRATLLFTNGSSILGGTELQLQGDTTFTESFPWFVNTQTATVAIAQLDVGGLASPDPIIGSLFVSMQLVGYVL